MKQFYLLVHPDLFHGPSVSVKKERRAGQGEKGETEGKAGEEAQAAVDDEEVVSAGVVEVQEERVDSSVMRLTNSDSLARLNQLMDCHRQLSRYSAATPAVVDLPRPPEGSAQLSFYARHSAADGSPSFTFISQRCELPLTPKPAVLLDAIDAFLCRLMLAAGVTIPLALTQTWKEAWQTRAAGHRFTRLHHHMPWMFDTSASQSLRRQLETVRRDYRQEELHARPLLLSERLEQCLQFMYAQQLVRFSSSLTTEQRFAAMQRWSSLVSGYGDQLRVEEWVGTEIRIVAGDGDRDEEEELLQGAGKGAYRWQLGVMQLPWDMTQREVWRLCRRYLRGIEAAGEELKQQDEAEQQQAAAAAAAANDVISQEDWEATAVELRQRSQREQQPGSTTATQPQPSPTDQQQEEEGQAEDQQKQEAAQRDTVDHEQPDVPLRRRSRVPPRGSVAMTADWDAQLQRSAAGWLQEKLRSPS